MLINRNGKKCQVAEGTTVAHLRGSYRDELRNDQIVRQEGHGSRVLKESDSLKEGDHVYSIPKIIKGSGTRVEEEADLLRKDADRRSEVVVGNKKIGKVKFGAVLIKNVTVPPKRFGVVRTDLLFLLPTEYPKLPPIGFYLNYKWQTTDKHFIQRGVHGAPALQDEGWYWYCGALMKSDAGQAIGIWQPGSRADNGHNLVTLFAAARHHLRNDDE